MYQISLTISHSTWFVFLFIYTVYYLSKSKVPAISSRSIVWWILINLLYFYSFFVCGVWCVPHFIADDQLQKYCSYRTHFHLQHKITIQCLQVERLTVTKACQNVCATKHDCMFRVCVCVSFSWYVWLVCEYWIVNIEVYVYAICGVWWLVVRICMDVNYYYLFSIIHVRFIYSKVCIYYSKYIIQFQSFSLFFPSLYCGWIKS